jgi:hypothetical protein
MSSVCIRSYFVSAHCARQSVHITPRTVLVLWVRIYDLLFLSEKTISPSAVVVAGACLCY